VTTTTRVRCPCAPSTEGIAKEDARAWQTRPLEDVYPVVFLDALVLKIRDGGWCSKGLLPRPGDHDGR
jgi:hypothetical protein